MNRGKTSLVAILKKMYENTTASIKEGTQTKFNVFQESPYIFNYYFDYVLKVAAMKIDEAFPGS